MIKMIKKEFEPVYDRIVDCDESAAVHIDLEQLRATARCLRAYHEETAPETGEVYNNIYAMLRLIEDTIERASNKFCEYERLIVDIFNGKDPACTEKGGA